MEVLIITIIVSFWILVIVTNPNIEKNYETEHYVLFYDDIFRNFSVRKFIQLPFKFKK